jgi:hypothetical protein
MKLSTRIGILFWGNTFTTISRRKGITTTVRYIGRLGRVLPLPKGDLEAYSDNIDILFDTFPFLFLAAKQRCLLRGLLLYFFGKRRRIDIRLQFGSKRTDNGLETHCWISHGRKIQFEVKEVIEQYTPLVEYR